MVIYRIPRVVKHCITIEQPEGKKSVMVQVAPQGALMRFRTLSLFGNLYSMVKQTFFLSVLIIEFIYG